MKPISLVVTFMVLLALSSCNSKPSQPSSIDSIEERLFILPTIPEIYTSQEAREAYLTTHYWDEFDVTDTTLINNAAISEQAMANFIDRLYSVDDKTMIEAVTQMMKHVHQDSLMYDYFVALTDKYMYNPNSPMRNELFYIPVMQYVIELYASDDPKKVRYEDRLQMAYKNRVGTQATPIEWVTKEGKKMRLADVKSDYTLLFFNEPDCSDCSRIKTYINESPVFSHLFTQQENTLEKQITTVGIYTGEEVEHWRNADYPSFMINGYDSRQVISSKRLYDLKAFPTLYLLDTDKKVLLKDATIEQIEMWLYQNVVIVE